MDWSNVLPLVEKLAPSIATGLGGPLAGSAIAALETTFGITTDGSTTDKQNALVGALTGATPEQLLALKQADNDYALKMADLGFKDKESLATLAVNDRDSARKREEAVKDVTPRNMAYFITVGFFGVLAFMLTQKIPADSRDLLNILLGMLGTSYAGVISYYFGSSAGSQAKTDLLAKAQPILDTQ